MISAKARKTEKEYRAGEADSSSTIKDFVSDRKRYYKKYILKETVEEDDDTKATIMGSLTDTLLLDNDRFDSKFYLSEGTIVPTGLMHEFCNALYKHTMLARAEDGTITKEFIDLATAAYADSGYKIPLQRVLTNFVKDGAEDYYKIMLAVKPRNLIIVNESMISTAEQIINELKTSEVTGEIILAETCDELEVFNQLQIENIMYHDTMLKGMMDKVHVNHTLKRIRIFDLKCVWAVENFYEEYYLHRKAYIQLWVYYYLVCEWAKVHYPGYHVDFPEFIVCDSVNYYKPLIYAATSKDINDALLGFEYKGRDYKGVNEIIKDLEWAKENNEWRICRQAALQDGVVSLKRLN